jgi:short-subunit dehydrogenase
VAAKPGMAGYNVTKAGMLSLSETLYGELKPHNVGVTVVCPSFFQTNLLNEGRLEKIDRDLASKMMKVANFTADDVANAAVAAIAKKQLYVVLPRQGRVFWRLKRFFPNYVCNLLAKDWAKQLAHMKKQPPAAAPQQIAEKTAV